MAGKMQKIDNFFHSARSVFFFAGVAAIIAIIQITCFLFTNLEINGIKHGDEKEFLAWLSIAVAMLNVFAGYYVSILMARGAVKSIYWNLVALTTLVLVNSFAGLWMLVIQYIIIALTQPLRYYIWKYKKYKDPKWGFKNLRWIMVIINIIIVIFFFGLVILWGEQIYSSSWSSEQPWAWYLDATFASLSLMGSIAATFRWRHAYAYWGIVSLPLISLYLFTGNWILAGQDLIWLMLDIATVLAMTHQRYDKTAEFKALLGIED